MFPWWLCRSSNRVVPPQRELTQEAPETERHAREDAAEPGDPMADLVFVVLHRSRILDFAEVLCGGSPVPGFCVGPRGFGDALAQRLVPKELAHFGAETSGCVRLHEEAGGAVLDEARDASGADGDYGGAAGHGLQYHEPEGLRVRWHAEDVCGSIGLGEFLAGEHPREHGRCALKMGPECRFLRPPSNNREARSRDGLKDVLQIFDTLLRCNAADIHKQWLVGVAPGKPEPHVLVLELWMVPLRVDSLAPDGHSSDAFLSKLLLDLGTCHQCQIGLAMDEAKIPPCDRFADLPERPKVASGVDRDVGVVGEDQGHIEEPGADHPRYAEETWGGDMQDIRPKPLHDLDGAEPPVKAADDHAVHRQSEPPEVRDIETELGPRGRRRQVRRADRHLIPRLAEVPQHLGETVGITTDMGEGRGLHEQSHPEAFPSAVVRFG
mmetsp:Transcript_1855/g.5459  ORF Transcript_1855/g.5459 Transcript_1855/m.5459 type:complete len:438 (-) Transcript_1855:140-1453(-)